jgi:Amt family ammonium transporter
MMDSGDTTWLLISTALVFLMIPGLAFFYGGMVRKKNVLSVLMQCFISICVMSIWWILIGYTLAFGPDKHGLIGGLEWIGLRGVGLEPSDYASTVPHQLFMAFQMMFAIITPALIIGAFVERIKFSAFLVFSVLWGTFIYAPLCHWVWGGGWLSTTGALDFAGGTVVHINAGVAALVAALMIGKRKGHGVRHIHPHNLPFTVLGAALLWFGWFGFNAGSALAADGIAVSAFVSTNTAAAAAGLTWALIEWMTSKTPTVFGAVTGAVAGLVAITPAAGFVSPLSAIAIGILSGGICYVFVAKVKPALGYDDSLDAFGVHGIGGIVGAIATGIFASTAINPGGADGLLFGNPGLVWTQTFAVLVTIAFTGIGSAIIFKLVDITIGLRVSEKDEEIGLDLTQHRETGYTVID